MKVSDINIQHLVTYLRLDYEDLTDIEIQELESMLSAAKAYVRSYTGLDDSQIDIHEDITIAIKVLVQDMYDNRTYYVETDNINKVVYTILGMHSINLL